ncbi:MAG: glycosyltransferase involved in cell wall biosynthesis, partial [Pirellulaceae bacterium]
MAVPIQMCNYLPLIGQLRNPTLSVVVVTQNCAEQLRLMLTTVAPVADEIIVVDGGSSDHTEEVVASFQLARYIERPFRDDIADQKNFAIGQATCDWVCVLDSDETVGQEFRDVVRDLIKSRWHSAYEFPRYWLCS